MAYFKRTRVKVFLFLLMCMVVLQLTGSSLLATEEDSLRILYINSYHEGYKWSDDIRTAIEAVFSAAPISIELEPVYLDTQRMPVTDPKDYMANIARSIAYRYKYRDYDMIITSDDAAYRFVMDHGEIFNGNIPHLFCGLNDVSAYSQKHFPETGGAVEYVDIEATVALMLSLQPELKKIYYLSDESLTGRASKDSFLKVTEGFADRVTFHDLEGMNFDETMSKASDLPEDAAILYIIHYFDKEGNYFKYDEAISMLSEKATVPVYSMWEFYMQNGTIGGKMVSGGDQGQRVAEMAVNYFTIPNYDIHVTDENMNRFIFDYQQLERFSISVESLPEGSDVVNYRLEGQREVLILHSYNQGFQWTDHIDEGIREVLNAYDCNCEIYTEYMDLKRIDNEVYKFEFQQLMVKKYRHRKFDLIITSDDVAFQFARDYIQPNHGNPPIVFSGVNYLSDEMIQSHEAYTGVLEAYDVAGTIDAILGLQPEVRKLLVINDNTATGLGNRKNVEALRATYEDQLEMLHIGDLTMAELVELVGEQKEDTAILLMSFNRDRANSNYTYQQAIELLEASASVPMYGVWDFYLGNGIVGGYLTDGVEQGRQAGYLGKSILEGQKAEDLPIITSSPNSYHFDYEQMRRFDLSKDRLPEGAMLINSGSSFADTYRENSVFFNIVFLLLALTLLAIAFLLLMLRYSVRMNRTVNHLASYDHLTEVFNRGTGIKALEDYLKDPACEGQESAICFIDLNRLKEVNDRFGHKEGDHFIKKTVEVIRSVMGQDDVICRMGGDEFMVVLKNLSESEAGIFRDRLKKALKDVSEKDDRGYEYSVSLGMNHFSVRENIDVTDVIEQADTLMYRDKTVYRQSQR